MDDAVMMMCVALYVDPVFTLLACKPLSVALQSPKTFLYESSLAKCTYFCYIFDYMHDISDIYTISHILTFSIIMGEVIPDTSGNSGYIKETEISQERVKKRKFFFNILKVL